MKVVQMATDYKDILSNLECLSPDVILLDLDLRIGSGLDIITKIKEKSTAKILILTGLSDASLHKKIENLAAVAEIVDKSNAVETIVEAIKRSHKKSAQIPTVQTRLKLVSGGNSSQTRSG
jgi:DNA-binding NarL/FixJ family response regulator